MADIPITGHKLYDTLWNIEIRNRQLTPKLEIDGLINIATNLNPVDESPSCSFSDDCLWNHVLLNGGEPCRKCRNFTPGSYYRKD